MSCKKHLVPLIELLLDCMPSKGLTIKEENLEDKSPQDLHERSPLQLDEKSNDPYN